MSGIVRKIRSSMAANIIGAIVLMLFVFGAFVCTTGFFNFTDSFKREYETSTYHIADTATTLVNGDHLDEYLRGEELDEYEQSRRYLNAYTKRIGVSIIYVIMVDRTDYGRFVSVFNLINNDVDNTDYSEWELGHKREATNEEYRQKYRAIYEQEAVHETVYRMRPNDGSHPHVTTMVPLRNSNGEVAAILCIQRPIMEMVRARRPYLIKIIISTLVMSLLAAIFITVFVRKQILVPVTVVSEEAARFARENTKSKEIGEISKYAELRNLAASINTMETDMVRYIENLTTATAEKERIGTELAFARAIQEGSIPNEYPAFPDRSEFDIYGFMLPAKEVGGDFYNFFLIDDDHLGIVIGDVSGKGIPAALFMMVINILIVNRARVGGTPADILDYVNKDATEHNTSGMFVTVWLGILELSTGKVIAANAGHDDALICHRNGETAPMKSRHNIVLGAFEESRYKDFEFVLEKGDKMLLYTDGLTEATDIHDQLFGRERAIQAFDAYKDRDPQGIIEGVRSRVDEFVGEAPQFDDLTMLCLELRGV